ncbi:MAG: DUF6858 family protein [Bdellovibrio bacteriovorus]
MSKIQFLDKYPVFVEEIAKADTDCATVDDVVARLRVRVQAHPGASDIAVFDHLAHVKALPEGKVADEIRGSKHLIFCLSNAIPNALIAAVRPRALSVVETQDRFVISWLEAPVEGPNQIIAGWVESLRKG